MKEKILTFGLVLMLLVSGFTLVIGEPIEEDDDFIFTEGSGTKEDPYMIYDIDDLQAMKDDLSAHYALANDIDASETRNWNNGAGFEPIGENPLWPDYGTPFTGSLDGRDRMIYGLYIGRVYAKAVGLFGFVDENSEIRSTGIFDAEIIGEDYVGNLVGYNRGTISNSYATGIVKGLRDIGGLVGRNEGTVSGSYATGNVSGNRFVGGLVGDNYYGTVSNSYATGDVSGNGLVGGLVGDNRYGTVTNSYATGDVSGYDFVGGLVGSNHQGTVSNSYATGSVSGNEDVGGLVGSNREGTVSNSHYNIDTMLINGDHYVTIGGVFDAQYQDWFNNDLNLDISDYSGTLVPSGDYYEISSVDGLRDLLGFTDRGGYKFSLATDIELSGASGLYIPYLAAEFDGQNHAIFNLHINMSFAACVGMFGYVDGGEIRNMGVVDADVSGSWGLGGVVGFNAYGTVENSYAIGNVSGGGYVGGLVGWNRGGTVSNSYATGDVSGTGSNVGGLVGWNRGGTVSNSYATGNVSGDWAVGGLVGYNYYGTVSNSYAAGDVDGNDNVGGLVGRNSGGTVSNSYSTGNVSGYDFVGGLVGYNLYGTVSNSYAMGSVTRLSGTSGDIGGFVGMNYRGKITKSYSTGSVHYEDAADPTDKGFAGSVNTFDEDYEMTGNFWDVETSGQTSTSGNATGKTTAEMMDITTFSNAGWDIVGVADLDNPNTDYTWNIIDAVTYPFLSGVIPVDEPPETVTPQAPRNLQASAGDGYIELTWTPPTSDGGSPITDYYIYRGTTSGALNLYATVGGATTTYTDHDVTGGTTYYWVSAVNDEGEGPRSAEVSATLEEECPKYDLAKQHFPILKFDSGETCFPTSVHYHLDNSNLYSAQGERLKDAKLTVNDIKGYSDSTLHKAFYMDLIPQDVTAHYIANRNHYGDVAYAYVTEDTYDGVTYTSIQYWFYYAYNEGVSLLNNHEGDWEMVTILLNEDEKPVHMRVAQHYWGDTKDWADIETDGDNPVIYVSQGSHASYFEPGGKWWIPGYSADGQGTVLNIDNIEVVLLDEENEEHKWLDFAGCWGNWSYIKGRRGPQGPMYRFDGEAWNNPAQWVLRNRKTSMLNSPANVTITDDQGRMLGFVDGDFVDEIPYAYGGALGDVEMYELPADGVYTYEVRGYDEGTYKFIVENEEYKLTFESVDIPIYDSSVHRFTIDWEKLEAGERGVLVQFDIDGDGTFEATYDSYAEFTHNNYDEALMTDDDDNGEEESTGMGMLMWALPLVAAVVIVLVTFMMKGKKGSVVDDEASDDTIEEDTPDEDI